MIIGCIGVDERLRDQLRSLPGVTAVYGSSAQHVQDQMAQFQTCEIILFSDSDVSLYELDQWKQRFEGCKLGYLSSYEADISALADRVLTCKRLGIAYFPPKRTVEQLNAEIAKVYLQHNDPETGAKVISFIGTLGQIGVTATVLSLADQLMRLTNNIKVGVLGFNCSTPGDQLLAYEGSYLNELVQGKDITAEEMQSHMQQHESGFFYLAGNRDLTKKYRFPSDHIQHWIVTAKQLFDIVLIDAGSSVDNNLCLQAILHADMRVVMTTKQPSALMHWHRQQELINVLTPELTFMLLVNKGDHSGARQLQQALKLPLLGWLPDVPAGWEYELERQLLTTTDHAKYHNQLQAIISLIHERFQLSPRFDKKAAWWRRRREV